MTNVPIRKPRCADCPYYGCYNEPVPRKVQGAFLGIGSRYCTGGRRIKVFKSRDPKVYVPTWCPRRKSPTELRVYCFKDSAAWLLRYLLERDGVHNSPSGHEYAVRYEGHAELTARDFYKLIQEKSITEVSGIQVQTGEIIEIDDGLKPYYFHVVDYGVNVLPYFDGDRARKNKPEHSDTDT